MPKKPIVIARFNGPMDQFFRSSMNQMMDPWQRLFPLSSSKWQPHTDILETKDAFLVRLELAGVDKDEVSIVYQDDHLAIYGRRQDPMARTSVRYLQLEINYQEFERVIVLPQEIEAESIEAHLENGILLISVPKTKPSLVSKKIAVSVK